MTFTEEQLENAGNAWQNRIIRVVESESMICITYRIPTPDEKGPINIGSGDLENPIPKIEIDSPIPGIGIEIGLEPGLAGKSIFEQKAILRRKISPTFDPIGGAIENEIENRFSGGEMTVCHRKEKKDDKSDEPINPNIPAPDPDIYDFPPSETTNPLDKALKGWIYCSYNLEYVQNTAVFYSRGNMMPGSQQEFPRNNLFYEIEFLDPIRVINRRSPVKSSIGLTISWVEQILVECSGYRFPPLGRNPSLGKTYYQISGKSGQFYNALPTKNVGGGGYLFYYEGGTEISGLNFRLPPQNTTPPSTTSPPSTTLKNDMDNCCKEIKKRLDEIERKIDRLLKFSGAASGGFEVPDSLLDSSPGNDWTSNIWDAITPDKKRHIKSMPEFWMWWIEKQKEWWGNWPACQEDDKGNQMAIPNLAEAVKVITGKEIILQREIAAAQLATIKALLESAQDRNQNIYNASLIQCLLDFFEIDPEEEIKYFPFQISRFESENLTMEDIDTPKEIGQLCQGASHGIKVAKIDFKKTRDSKGKPKETFSATALRTLKMWEAMRAIFGVQLDSENLEGDLRKFFTETQNFAKGKNGLGQPVAGNDDTNDFSQWCEKVEQQFGNEANPPESAATQPWGNELSDRPRIIVRGDAPTEENDM